jgi:hypothetical protein
MYFWAGVTVVLVLMCVIGWRMDRRHKGSDVTTHPGGAVDARGNEVMAQHRNLGGGSFGGSI